MSGLIEPSSALKSGDRAADNRTPMREVSDDSTALNPTTSSITQSIRPEGQSLPVGHDSGPTSAQSKHVCRTSRPRRGRLKINESFLELHPDPEGSESDENENEDVESVWTDLATGPPATESDQHAVPEWVSQLIIQEEEELTEEPRDVLTEELTRLLFATAQTTGYAHTSGPERAEVQGRSLIEWSIGSSLIEPSSDSVAESCVDTNSTRKEPDESASLPPVSALPTRPEGRSLPVGSDSGLPSTKTIASAKQSFDTATRSLSTTATQTIFEEMEIFNSSTDSIPQFSLQKVIAFTSEPDATSPHDMASHSFEEKKARSAQRKQLLVRTDKLVSSRFDTTAANSTAL